MLWEQPDCASCCHAPHCWLWMHVSLLKQPMQRQQRSIPHLKAEVGCFARMCLLDIVLHGLLDSSPFIFCTHQGLCLCSCQQGPMCAKLMMWQTASGFCMRG